MSGRVRYTLLGAGFGLLLPLGCLAFLALSQGLDPDLGFGGWVRLVHQRFPLLWVIDTAPLFLSFFSRLAGIQDDRLRQMNENLERLVQERTEALRLALAASQEAHDRISQMADCDALTGIHNRRSFLRDLERHLGLARRGSASLAVLFLDLDGFKAVNDNHGHEVGDAYLQAFAALVQEALRDSDLVARWGGDEFVILLPQGDGAAAGTTALRLEALMAEAVFPCRGAALRPRASIGWAVFPGDGGDANGLMGAADRAMYQMKMRRRGHLEPSRAGAHLG